MTGKKKPENAGKWHRFRFWRNKEKPDEGTRRDGGSKWPEKLLKKFKKPKKGGAGPSNSKESSRDTSSQTATSRESRSSGEVIKEPNPKKAHALPRKENVPRPSEAPKKDANPPKPRQQEEAKERTTREREKTTKEKPNEIKKQQQKEAKEQKAAKEKHFKEQSDTISCDMDKTAAKNHHLSREFKQRQKKGSEEDSKDGKSKGNSLRRQFSSFRERQAKNWTLVKTFMSRPYKAQSMQKILGKVSQRKEYREKQSASSENSNSSSFISLLKQGDEMPTPASPSTSSKQCPPSSEGNSQLHVNIKQKLFKSPQTIEEKTVEKTREDTKEKGSKEKGEKRRLKLVKNNDNGGKLFVEEGRPFWQQKGKIKERKVDPDDDLTDDEVPMNAECLLDVHLGKLKLIEMPHKQVTLDPYATLEVLESRDELFFVRNIIFSNTVRSMINLNDDATLSEKKTSAVQEKGKLTWKEEPKQIGAYDPRKPKTISKEKWK
ncbi:hypothetical protein L596_013799 [Steinernema carpocapsae]|uniref:Uncharacterized protein n=1 Tax=Steinernema carpocapsae TaxID=34508 RepID=A0A4U5P1D8_STECR|nr:hypothetical protein L596_013799 [Steinernema carpocapsae]